MQVKLKVLHGKSAGKEVKIPAKEFVIGRGDECHLRPKSDAISRRHCVVAVKESQVTIRDLGSRNGTFVNDERVEGEQVLAMGDRLKIGPLEFEVVIDHSIGGAKRPKVRDVKEAASRTADHESGDVDISQWLEEADEGDRVRRLADPDTRQFRFDQTDRVEVEKPAAEPATQETAETPAETLSKKPPGKLPPREKAAAKDSRDAAAEMLKKFFHRR